MSCDILMHTKDEKELSASTKFYSKTTTLSKTLSFKSSRKKTRNRYNKRDDQYPFTFRKTHKTSENCFISTAVITIKDKSFKIALNSIKLKKACVKRKAAMPNIGKSISKISAEITKSDGEMWMSKMWITHMDKHKLAQVT